MDNLASSQFNDLNINILLSFIAEGLIMFDKDGYITTLNPHASLLLDYTSDELIGRKLDEITPVNFEGEQVDSSDYIAAQVLKGKVFSIPVGKTLYFKTRSGRKFPVFASAKGLLSSNNTDFEGGVMVFRDITTEKELETYKENTAKTLSELTPVLQKTATGDFSFSPNLPEEEDEFTELLVGLRLMLDDLRELDLEREKSELEKISALEEKRLLTENYSKELENEVAKKTDELSKANDHIETIIKDLPNGLIEYDNSFRIVRLNKAAEDVLGVKKENVLGKIIKKEDKDAEHFNSITLVVHPDLSEKTKKVSQEITGIDAEVVELSVTYPIERDLQITSVEVSGEGSGTLKIIRDITREKLISRSKSEFISIAAHQLRTPLSEMKWALNLLQKGDFGKLESEPQSIIERTFLTSEKMIDLVNDLLNVARIEDGRFGYEFKKNNFRHLIGNLVTATKQHAEEKGIRLTFTDKSHNAMEFLFDKNKMALALQNLVDNAVKYTPSGGSVEVILSAKDKLAQVEVVDTGVGVPEHQIDRLFTKFFRAENVTKLPVSGSGLGLFMARNVIIRHGGDIKVHSIKDQGTTFTFVIPTDEDKIPAKEVVASSLYM